MKFFRLSTYRVLFLVAPTFSLASVASNFNEDMIIQTLRKDGLASIEKVHSRTQAEEISQLSNLPYSWSLAPSLDALQSNADAPNSFQPALQNSWGFGLGVQKNWNIGIATEAGIKSASSELELASGAPLKSAEPTYYLQAQMSLYRNLLGKLDRATQRQARLNKKVLEIQGNMGLHQAIVNARSLYWSVMANAVSIRLSESLLATSKKQLNEVQRRFRSGAAERADIHLSEAQVSQRESALLNLKIKEESFMRELKRQVPGLQSPGGSGGYPSIDIEPLLATVSECLVQINAHPKAPIQYSDYGFLFETYKDLLEADLVAAEQDLGTEITLAASIESNGVDAEFGDAFSETNEFAKGSLGLQLSAQIPLDSQQSKLVRTRKKLAELKELKMRKQLELQLNATHDSALQSLNHILASIRTLGDSTTAFKKRIRAVEQKYRQGRVDFLSLVQEQDQLFNAEIGLTESRLVFLQEVFAYLAVFNRTPCDFNLRYAEIGTY